MNIPEQQTNLCLLMKEGQVLLAMKKRGFGTGRWNGVGGKLLEGETIESSLMREMKEEIGVTVHEQDLKKCGLLDFYFQTKPEWSQRVHVFFVTSWEGEPTETEEMKPQWFPLSAIPYDEMWVDDRHWLPIVLKGQSVTASFTFSDLGTTIAEMSVTPGPAVW